MHWRSRDWSCCSAANWARARRPRGVDKKKFFTVTSSSEQLERAHLVEPYDAPAAPVELVVVQVLVDHGGAPQTSLPSGSNSSRAGSRASATDLGGEHVEAREQLASGGQNAASDQRDAASEPGVQQFRAAYVNIMTRSSFQVATAKVLMGGKGTQCKTAHLKSNNPDAELAVGVHVMRHSGI